MSVPTYKRSTSSAQFIYDLYTFNIRIGEICMNSPKKYKMNYADKIIQDSLDALKYARLANDIYINKSTTERDFMRRKEYLRMAKSLIEHVATVCEIFLEQQRKYGSCDSQKILKNEEFVGVKCSEISDMLSALIKSDRQRQLKYSK